MTRQEEMKRQAAENAVGFVRSGMKLGLGSGSTARYAVQFIGQRLKSGVLTDIVGVPASDWIAEEARQWNIPLVRLEDHAALDLTIDGADEVAPDLSLIKGGGGALLREKLIAQASQRTIIIVDGSKCVSRLGTNWAIPIEVVPFGWSHQQRYLEAQGAAVTRRLNSDGTAFFTDNGNLVLDANFGMVDDPQRLADKLKSRTGIVEHGLFIGLATDAIVAYTDRVTHYRGHMPAEADR